MFFYLSTEHLIDGKNFEKSIFWLDSYTDLIMTWKWRRETGIENIRFKLSSINIEALKDIKKIKIEIVVSTLLSEAYARCENTSYARL